MFFSFSLLIGGGAVLGHLYLYWRLFHRTTSTLRWRLIGASFFIAATLLLMFRRSAARSLEEPWSAWLAQATYVWMGCGILLLVACVAVDLLALAVRGLQWTAQRRRRTQAPERAPDSKPAAPEADPERRRFVAQAVAGTAVVVGGGLGSYGAWRAFSAPEVSEVVVKLPRLPRTLDGLTLVQLTDIHVGPFIRRAFMDELVARVNALKPDLVAVTGDLVDGDVATLGSSVAALANIRTRFGQYFVTGNHEYGSGDAEWTAFLESIGIAVLRNRHVQIGDAGGTLDLVGVDDWSGGRRRGRPGYDFDKAVAGRDPERAAILLAHQPANFEAVASRGIGLQLSGHTHGGQLFPGTLLVGLRWDYTRGLYHHGDASIYVSRGCGFWGPPMRVGSPPEIVKVTLTA